MSKYTTPDNSPLRTPYRVIKCLRRGLSTASEIAYELDLGKSQTALRHLNAAYDEGLVKRETRHVKGTAVQYIFSLD